MLILDEAARVPDELYAALRPMLAVGGGRLVLLSTPFGKRGFFWREWSEQASGFVKSASQTLQQINSPKHQPKDVLLELVDAGRAGIRSMTELPRHTASRFIDALDEIDKRAKKAAPPKRAATRRRARRPKRAGRAKA